jgi:peptide/nickel transport system permease protein
MNLRYYLLRRLLLIIPVLFGLSLLTFTVSRVVPGDPVGLAAGPQATQEIKETLRQEFGLDKPLPVQYVNYIANMLKGDLGRSLYTRHDVVDDLRAYFPATLELTLVAMIFATVLGVPAGIISAMFRDRLPDHISRVISLFFVSFPSFWLAMIFQMFFGLEQGWFPTGRRFDVLTAPPSGTGLFLFDSLLGGELDLFGTAVSHITLPALVLSFSAFASITRITRASMLEVLEKDYIRMERAMGIPNRVVIIKYALRNAFIATLTVISLNFGWLMAGAILIETIFDWPGLGLYAVESSLRLDFQPIMGITLVYGVVFSLVNIFTDIAYGILDPRIRYG